MKYFNTYSYDLMTQNISDAYNAIYQIENGLQRRVPTISRWKGYYMASYMVEGKTRWNYAYRIEGDTVYVEDACHAQNMSEFSTSLTTKTPQKYRRLTRKPIFGYSFVMNDKKEYNLLSTDGKLLTQWFRAFKAINQSRPYGKYQIIAYINVGGMFCALGYDGQVYNLGKSWKEMYTENRNIFNTQLFMDIITESIDSKMNNKKVIRLTESDLHNIIGESVRNVLNELDSRTYASAAKKRQEQAANAYQQGDQEQADKFARKSNRLQHAAIDSYNRDYGSIMRQFDTNGVERYMSIGDGMEHSINKPQSLSSDGKYNPYGTTPTYHVNSTRMKRNLGQKLFGGGSKYSTQEYNPSDDIEYHSGKDRDGKWYHVDTANMSRNNFDNAFKDNKNAYRVAREMQKDSGRYVKGNGWQ